MLIDPTLVRDFSQDVFGVGRRRRQRGDGRFEPMREPAFIVRFDQPVPEQTVLKGFIPNLNRPGARRTLNGTTYYVRGQSAACMIKPNTLLAGPEITLKTMLSANDSASPIAKLLLKSKPADDFLVALTGESITEFTAASGAARMNAALVQIMQSAAKVKSLLATGRLTGKSLLSLQLEAADAATAKQLAGVVKTVALPLTTGFYQSSIRKSMLKENRRAFEPIVELGDEFLKNIRVTNRNASIAINFDRPKSLDTLTGRLGPFFKMARIDAQRNKRKLVFKQIGIAFHNYHETHLHFPSHGSNGAGGKGGLSWRVHILPYIEQGPLYKQFKLNESWDSPHNKKLIAKMPKIYQHPKVKAAGKTPIHVFVGDGTPFGNLMRGPRFRDIVDGTSNTIMAIEAGPDKAEIWTKPGGILFDAQENPFDELGNLDDTFLILLMDGAARFSLGTELSKRVARSLREWHGPAPREYVLLLDSHSVQHLAYSLFLGIQKRQPDDMLKRLDAKRQPAGIVRFLKPVELKAAVTLQIGTAGFRKGKRLHAGTTYYVANGTATCLVDPKTLLIGPEAVVKEMITANNASSPLAKLLLASEPADDVIVAFTGSALEQAAKVVPRDETPATIAQLLDGLAESKSLLGTVRLTGNRLAALQMETADPKSAVSLATTLKNGVLPALAALFRRAIQHAMPNVPRRQIALFMKLVAALFSNANIETDDSTVRVVLDRPRHFEQLPDRLGFVTNWIKSVDRLHTFQSNLLLIGVAMNSYHDSLKRFPRHGSDHTGRRKGLSWRVHLLPFLDDKHAALYKQFKLDEPWDSPHNKKLIARMPDVYRQPGVAAAGKTSLHVFVGQQTPFGGDKPGIKRIDVVDGAANTILVVAAGANKADFWTKPGGISFSVEENPLVELGDIGDSFFALMMDTSIRRIEKTIDLQKLKRLIQHDDGLTVGDD
eukprot:g10272.t1